MKRARCCQEKASMLPSITILSDWDSNNGTEQKTQRLWLLRDVAAIVISKITLIKIYIIMGKRPSSLGGSRGK